MPANLRFFCHQNNSSVKFKILNHRINVLHFTIKLYWWQKKRKLVGMRLVSTLRYFHIIGDDFGTGMLVPPFFTIKKLQRLHRNKNSLIVV